MKMRAQWRQQAARLRIASPLATLRMLGGALAVIALTAFCLAQIDWSDPLSAGEAADLARFVERTQSEVVTKAFNDARTHGELTQRKAASIIEIAKEQTPGYGLAGIQ